jgi:hypothetical protein
MIQYNAYVDVDVLLLDGTGVPCKCATHAMKYCDDVRKNHALWVGVALLILSNVEAIT